MNNTKCEVCGIVGAVKMHKGGTTECALCGAIDGRSRATPSPGTGTTASAAGTIDTPEFRCLLGDMLAAYRAELQGGAQWVYEHLRPKLIAHINQWGAALAEEARREGYEAGRQLGYKQGITDGHADARKVAAQDAAGEDAVKIDCGSCLGTGNDGRGTGCTDCNGKGYDWDPVAEAAAQADDERASPTFMDERQAQDWAWKAVRKDCDDGTWTTGESGNYFGFFLLGWRYREQYEKQRRAALRQPGALPEQVKYVPVDSSLSDKYGNHPNDNEPRTDACRAALDARGDNRGQGLDPYWKWGFAAGFNAAGALPDEALTADDELFEAVGALIKARGRFHTEQNYKAVVEAYDAARVAAKQAGKEA